mgnify:CR=1 FL=1
MSGGDSLRNQFLVAMPGMEDGHFSHSVSLICEHNDEGAMGIVINRPTELLLGEMLEHIGIDAGPLLSEPFKPGSRHIFWGGPVQPERGFVIHRPGKEWESTLKIGDHFCITTSKDILEAIGQNNGPEHYLITLGYAGWTAGQLEQEILENTWLNAPSDSAIIFDAPATERWHLAANSLGIDVSMLSSESGHA